MNEWAVDTKMFQASPKGHRTQGPCFVYHVLWNVVVSNYYRPPSLDPSNKADTVEPTESRAPEVTYNGEGAPKSKRPLSSSASTVPANPAKRASNSKLALGIKSNENLRRSARQNAVAGEKDNKLSTLKVQQKKKSKKSNAKPKKPPTAFFYFLEDFRKEYQEQNPDVKSMREIGKACGEKWKTMTYEEKVQYYDVATEKRAEFDRATAEYIKRKESGEDLQEHEDDSEFDE